MFQTKWIKLDYLLVLVVGIAFLFVSYQLIYKGMAISDEIVYAIVARNIVERGTLDTNVYRADSIVLRGYPTRDVHTPGYVLTLAAVFALFGINKFVLVWPSFIAYLLTGLIFYHIGKSIFKPAIAFWATLLFYIYPVSFISASLVMVESVLNLVAVIYLAYWLKISRAETPRLLEVTLLAIFLIVGMLYRETFILFLPPALFILVKSGWTRKNYRLLLIFGLVFTLLLVGLFWPLIQHRAYYPFSFDKAVEAENWLTKIEILSSSFLNNLSLTSLSLKGVPYYYGAAVNLMIGIIATIMGLCSWRDSHRDLALLSIYLFWTALLMLTAFLVHIFDWVTPRHMLTFLLPGLLVFAGGLVKLKHSFIRYGVMVIVILIVGFSTFQVTQVTQYDQRKSIRYEQFTSSIVTKYLKPYAPQTIMFDQAFEVAWEHYPVTLIWTYPTSYNEMQILEERLPIDAIVVNNEQQRDVILDAGRTGLLSQRYISLFPYKVEGYYFLINERLQRQSNGF